MVLRKQTVWLITMLSLLIVLSVFYMFSPGSDQVVMVDEEDPASDESRDGEDSDGDIDDQFIVSNLAGDDYFTTIRLETEDARNELKEHLTEVIASGTATSDEKNQAMDQIYAIETTAQKESILERMIMQEKGFEDVLVRTDDHQVSITVLASELSRTDANHMMQMARDEFGMMDVTVRFQGDAEDEPEEAPSDETDSGEMPDSDESDEREDGEESDQEDTE